MTYQTGREGRERIGKLYYYIVARYGNRLVIIGPKDTEEEAQSYGWQKLEVEFEVIGLTTRDRGKASAQIKARQLDSTGDLGGAIQRSMRKAPGDYNSPWWGGQE